MGTGKNIKKKIEEWREEQSSNRTTLP